MKKINNIRKPVKMEKKFKMEPKTYSKYLDSVRLLNISLRESKTKYFGDLQPPKKQELSVSDSTNYSKKEDLYEILQKYVITGKTGKKKILEISATFCVILKSDKELSDEFFEIYNEISLPINTWPFLREFANSMTARMNISPLTLPLLRR